LRKYIEQFEKEQWAAFRKQEKEDKLKITTVTSVFEIIQGLGPGRTYEYEGLSRFSFFKNATITNSSTTKSVWVTRTYWDPEQRMNPGFDKRLPSCSFSNLSCLLLYSRILRRNLDPSDFLTVLDEGPNIFFVPDTCAKFNFFGPNNTCTPEKCPYLDVCNLLVGHEVVLIYWPPDKARQHPPSYSNNLHNQTVFQIPSTSKAPRTYKTTAITFRGQDLYLRTWIRGNRTETLSSYYVTQSTLLGNWTFTSPTMYIAHQAIEASRTFVAARQKSEYVFAAVLRRGYTAMPAAVVPIKPGDIYTLNPIPPGTRTFGAAEYASLIAAGEFNPKGVINLPESRSLDLSDLEEPIAASLYYDARSSDCWGKQSHCSVLTEGNYRPLLRLAEEAWLSILPEDHWHCSPPLLVDPPIRLTELPEDKIPSPTLAKIPAEPTGMIIGGLLPKPGSVGEYPLPKPKPIPPTPLPTPNTPDWSAGDSDRRQQDESSGSIQNNHAANDPQHKSEDDKIFRLPFRIGENLFKIIEAGGEFETTSVRCPSQNGGRCFGINNREAAKDKGRPDDVGGHETELSRVKPDRIGNRPFHTNPTVGSENRNNDRGEDSPEKNISSTAGENPSNDDVGEENEENIHQVQNRGNSVLGERYMLLRKCAFMIGLAAFITY
jgi:hypothetical protein